MIGGRRFRILAVDDDEDALDVVVQALSPSYDVFAARSGAEALEILAREKVDLLITDQRMPEMSGIQLIEESKKIHPDMVRIILTGYTEPRDLIDAINRGEVYRYITKPWDLADLLFTIKNGLENLELRRDRERLLHDLELRLNAMAVFLDLSSEAARVGSYQELVKALLKYLPFIVDFDACAALVEDDGFGRSLLHIHCRKSLSTDVLQAIRIDAVEAYLFAAGQRITEDRMLLEVSGDASQPEGRPQDFQSVLEVALRSDGRPAGLIRLLAFAPDAFRSDTRELLDILANQTSAIINALRHQLASEQHRLELMVWSLPDGVIMVDDRERVFVINPAARRLLHLEPETTVDTRFLKDTLGFYPFDLVRGWAARGRTVFREEIQAFDRTLDSIVSPVTLGEKVVGVAVVLRDITEERALEQRKEEFISIVHHEIRTPLTSIGGALDLMLHRYAGDINPKQERYLTLAKSSCDKLNMVIDDLLDLDKLAEGKLVMEMESFRLSELLQEATESYQAAALERKVALSLEVASDFGDLQVLADRNRLHQVINNLLSNALKFTSEGGHIRVELLRVGAVQDLVGVSVWNDGREEIEERDQMRVFDKYEQAKQRRGGAVAGSGLGLSISKRIVEEHGGRIWVESGRGTGTRFVFTLFVSAGQDQSGQREETAAARFKVAPKLLVVDDDVPLSLLLKGLLMVQGFEVTLAHAGEDALRLARERQPDLILMDIRLPSRDGLEITDILHHDPETREIPVLCVSEFEVSEQAFKAGAAAFLPKPFQLSSLLATIADLLSQRNLVRRLFKVLIIDDDPAIRAICREVLERQGYAVLEADSGQAGLDALQKAQIDVVLLDVMLPDFDGFQVTERIRADRNLADLPVVFISAKGQTADKVRALRTGGDDYLVKPFDALELGARVESLLQRKERELDSSPTTKLPGSFALQREVNRRLRANQAFVLCYLDLDNFKAFNDYYGYAKADGVIAQTGDLIRKAVEQHGTPEDFVGHIAGDDFVLVTALDRIDAIGKDIIDTFDRIIPLYYNRDDQSRGYIEIEDRFGELRRFRFLTISLASVVVSPGMFRTHSEIALRAAGIKKRAKAIEGSVLVLDNP